MSKATPKRVVKRTTMNFPLDLYKSIRRHLLEQGDSNVSRFMELACREKLERDAGTRQ